MSCKIFVGNVPFDCTLDDFTNCFVKIDGFIKGDIITKHNMEQSRGFGFVTIDTRENANKLLKNNSLSLKGRFLRFTDYVTNDGSPIRTVSPKTNSENKQPKYIVINFYRELDDKEKDDVKNTIEKYIFELCLIERKNTGKFFRVCDRKTGKLKNTFMMEFFKESDVDKILKNKKVVVDDYVFIFDSYQRLYIKKHEKKLGNLHGFNDFN